MVANEMLNSINKQKDEIISKLKKNGRKKVSSTSRTGKFRTRKKRSELMAERVGFEPTVPLTVHKLSKPAPIF